jgi:hypothetical protein
MIILYLERDKITYSEKTQFQVQNIKNLHAAGRQDLLYIPAWNLGLNQN